MDPNYLTAQVSTIISQLHKLFDDIGVPNHERQRRESEVCSKCWARNIGLTINTALYCIIRNTTQSAARGHRVRPDRHLTSSILLIAHSEKSELTEEAHRIVKMIKQMEASLEDRIPNDAYKLEDAELKVTVPLTRCLQGLKEKHNSITKTHRERFEQVKSRFIPSQKNRR